MAYKSRRNEALDFIARSIINQYDPNLLHTPTPIPIEDIMEKSYGLTIEYQHIRKDGRILGETIFEDALIPIYEHKDNEGYKLIPVKAGTIIIDASLLSEQKIGRHNFTLAHELAHWILDKNYFTQLGETAAMTLKPAKSSETTALIERQADRMASRLLMPKKTIKMAYHDICNNTPSIISQPASIIGVLAELFVVSKQAMGIRLREMGLITQS